jgi:hypothetical protein
MRAKYKIEFAVPRHGRDQPEDHFTDDPIEAEDFLSRLLERGFKILGILHEGVEVSQAESDRMIKTAVGLLTTRNLCRSLGIDSSEAHNRFGSPA